MDSIYLKNHNKVIYHSKASGWKGNLATIWNLCRLWDLPKFIFSGKVKSTITPYSLQRSTIS